MFEQQRWPREAWLPISSGLLWLWRHWDRPLIEWYQGGHVSFRFHQQVRRMLDEALRECELVAS